MATSKAFVTNESELKVNGEAGADHAWSMENIGNDAGRVSVQIDLGARPGAFLISWNCKMQWVGTPTVNDSCDFYKAGTPDATAANIDGDIGQVDAALGNEVQLKNLRRFGSVVVDTADTSVQSASGEFVHYGRYITFIGMNKGGTSINATDSNFAFFMTVRAIQGQAT